MFGIIISINRIANIGRRIRLSRIRRFISRVRIKLTIRCIERIGDVRIHTPMITARLCLELRSPNYNATLSSDLYAYIIH